MTRRPAKPAKAPAAKRKPGRPKKPAVPKSAPVDYTPATAMQEDLKRVLARHHAGQRLANHEARVLRDAWLLDQNKYLWPSIDACAAELSVSANTVRSYAEQGCPDLVGHSPIPKASVLAWLLKRSHERGGERFANTDLAEEADARWKMTRALREEGRLLAEAEDQAQRGLLDACAALRARLTQHTPGAIYDAVTTATYRLTAEALVTELIETALRDGAQLAPTPATESTP